MRNKYKQIMSIGLFSSSNYLLLGTKSKYESTVAMERFVAQAIEANNLHPDSAIELLEKLYISVRIFVEHVHQYGPTMTLMIAYISLYIYTFILIGAWYMYSVDNFILEPALLVIFAWLLANTFILPPSKFHAKVSDREYKKKIIDSMMLKQLELTL